jgi:hypothetical protein
MKQVPCDQVGELIFIECSPVDPYEPPTKTAIKVVQRKVEFHITEKRIIFEFLLKPSFLKSENLSNEFLNRLVMVDLEFDNNYVRYVSKKLGIQVSCEVFKTGSSYAIIGDLYPTVPSGMPGLKNFHLFGMMRNKR